MLCDSFLRYGSAQAIGLKAAGADVTLYYVDRLNEFAGDASERDAYVAAARDAGVATVLVPARNMRRLPQQTVWLHRDIARRGIECLIVHAHIDPRYATLGFRFGVALFIHDPTPHSGDFESSFPAPVRALSRFAEATAGAVILHSARLAPQLIPLLRGLPLITVPHGTPMEAAPAAITSPPMILMIGRLMEYKGIDVALDAFRDVHTAHPDVTMVLAGRGNLGDQIRAADPPGVELRDGYIPDAELDALLDRARLVLLPYRDATQSGVGLLAAARGIPCVVSEAGALPDLVPPGREERVVPIGDSPALRDAILSAITHGADDRQAAFTYAADHFDWPVVGQRTLRELRHVGLARITSR